MKVVLVDDEPFHLIGMRSIIPWEQHNCTIVGEARSGREGIEVILREKPDVVIVDILMPGMDGLEMIRRVRDIQNAPKFIVLSCLNDIQYYKESVKLGVTEYLQKELVTPEVLCRTIDHVCNLILQEQRIVRTEENKETALEMGYQAKAEYLFRLMNGYITDFHAAERRLDKIGMIPSGSTFSLAVCSVKNMYSNDEVEERVTNSAISVCEKIWCQEGYSFFFRMVNGRFGILLRPVEKDRMNRVFERIKNTVEQSLDCMITIGISEESNRIDRIQELYGQACRAEEIRYYYGNGKLYYFDAISSRKKTECRAEIFPSGSHPASAESWEIRLNMLRQELEGKLPEKKEAQIRLAAFVEYIRLLTEQYDPVSIDVENEFEDVARRCYTSDSLEETITVIRTLMNVIEASKAPRRVDELVRGVKEYVRSHIYERIQLTDVAASVYMSSSYVSRIFKQETGMNLNDYIRAEKIKQAKLLLRKMPVYEVAERLGYNSISYFVSVFKKMTKMTPYKYKQQLQKEME